ncbi:hypothetical protein D9611_008627 [Ephemerocybe angulata]|uniref:C2 domain-containing protein n=1 Tax=Ephemerocybe angulata TaxID=980116 RepID=A0A8H5EV30_9AGAR|nr:hypothetical protein D9611_008627 [Tulosesus angulatus]
MSCPGIPINSDISGPGVRISLYIQSLLTVILVRASPEDAPGAYWSMTATALGLIITTLVTGLLEKISLLDAIVVTYVLILPIVASAFGVADIAAAKQLPNQPTTLRRAYSPLLIIANWLRSALTYAFTLFVWAKAPSFGSGPPECDQATKLIFFGAALPALGSGRVLNLVGWGILASLFMWRTVRGGMTLMAAFRGLFSDDVMVKPKTPPKNELNLETTDTYNYVTGEKGHEERAYRPAQVFHEMLQGMMNQILGWAPRAGTGRWYHTYGQVILAMAISIWAIAMTELELKRNVLEGDINKEWGFGQFLPLILTISPVLALYEAALKKRARGELESSKRNLRFCIVGAHGLKRPRTEIDHLTEDQIADLIESGQMTENTIKAIRAPSPFAVLTVDGKDLYTTYDLIETTSPEWRETFDTGVSDTSTIVVRVFDLKCMDRGWPSLIGYTTILPFSMLPPGPAAVVLAPPTIPRAQITAPEGDDTGEEVAPTDEEGAVEGDSEGAKGAMKEGIDQIQETSSIGGGVTEASADWFGAGSSTVVRLFPLVRDREVVPGMSVEFSISSDTSRPPPISNIPGQYLGIKKVNQKRNVSLVKWRGKTVRGHRKVVLTETHQLDND